MSKLPRISLLAALVATLSLAPAIAETLRCRSVNGNVTCSGSGAVSCQTVNGRTTCIGGNGAVVQQFGGVPPTEPPAITKEDEPATEDEAPPAPSPQERLSIERRSPHAWMSLQRDGTRLRLRTNRLSIDLD